MAKIKKTASLLSCILATVILAWGCSAKEAYAANIVVTGDTQGLGITPSNENVFSTSGMLPGESAASRIEIRNTDNYPFLLSAEVTNKMGGDAIDLLQVLNISVSMNGEEITNFPAKGGRYELGRFIPGQTALLDIDVALPGAIGNEYQMKTVELQWVFSAVSEYQNPSGGGGGGSGSGSRSSSATPAVPVVLLDDELPEMITLEDAPIPMDVLELDIPEDVDDEIELLDENTPLGGKQMPKTGETSLMNYILTGIVISILGITLLLQGKKQKRDSKR